SPLRILNEMPLTASNGEPFERLNVLARSRTSTMCSCIGSFPHVILVTVIVLLYVGRARKVATPGWNYNTCDCRAYAIGVLSRTLIIPLTLAILARRIRGAAGR